MKELTEATFQTLCDVVVAHDHAGIVKLLSEGGIDAGRKFDQDAGTTFCETICDQS